MRSKWILISVPFIIVILFFNMAYSSRQTYFSDTNPSGYQGLEHRKLPYLANGYSDVDIIIDISSIDPQNRSVSVSFFIRAWFTKNYTNFMVREGYCIFEYLNITYRGGSAPLHYFYQIEEADRGPYSHQVWGYPERFPYDYYKIRYHLHFWNIDPNLKFPSDFHPSISVKAPSGWTARAFMNVTGGEPLLDREVYIVLSRSDPTLLYSSSIIFLFILLECLIIGSLILIHTDKENLSTRIMVLLTSSVLVLTFYNTYLSKMLTEEGVSYVQILFISVIASNMIFLAFSLLGMYLPKKIHDISIWDFAGLTMSSLIPFIFCIICVLFLYPQKFDTLSFRWILEYYIDYRILLWLTLYVPIIWLAFLTRTNVLCFHFSFTGLLVSFLTISDLITQNLEPIMLFISLLLLIIGLLSLFSNFIKHIKKRAIV